MNARFKFREDDVRELPLCLEMTATLPEWEAMLGHLKGLAQQGDNKLLPLEHCIANMVKAIREATGASYLTRSYTYSTEREA